MTARVPDGGIDSHFLIYLSLKASSFARLVFVISRIVNVYKYYGSYQVCVDFQLVLRVVRLEEKNGVSASSVISCKLNIVRDLIKAEMWVCIEIHKSNNKCGKCRMC